MVYKEPSIYKSGISLKDVSKSITTWKDVTNEFSLKNHNMFFNGGAILKNEILKELKFSIRIDFTTIETLGLNTFKEYLDILAHNYSLVSGSTSLNGAYIGDYAPRGFCMMWNDSNTFNIQVYNPSNLTGLRGFVINGIVIYQ